MVAWSLIAPAAASPANPFLSGLMVPIPLWAALAATLIAAGLAVLTVVLVHAGRDRSTSTTTPTPASRPETTPSAQLEELLVKLLSQTHDHAELVAERLQQRADALQALVAAADQRIAALNTPTPPHSEVPRSRVAAADDPMAQRIFELADQGVPAVEIARRLGQHTGKVQLMLGLRGSAAPG